MVWCEVINREDASAEEGARCAALMNEVLTKRVLAPHTTYRALVFDVRRGPQAFGPKTRLSLEQIFNAAKAAERRVAVIVGPSATQRMQFGNLSLECAPRHSQVFRDELSARDWLDQEAVAR